MENTMKGIWSSPMVRVPVLMIGIGGGIGLSDKIGLYTPFYPIDGYILAKAGVWAGICLGLIYIYEKL